MKETQSNKPWQGRFTGTTDSLMEQFNASIDTDKRLYHNNFIEIISMR